MTIRILCLFMLALFGCRRSGITTINIKSKYENSNLYEIVYVKSFDPKRVVTEKADMSFLEFKSLLEIKENNLQATDKKLVIIVRLDELKTREELARIAIEFDQFSALTGVYNTQLWYGSNSGNIPLWTDVLSESQIDSIKSKWLLTETHNQTLPDK